MVVGFMRLMEKGLVSLDDAVSKYIHGFGQALVSETSSSKVQSLSSKGRQLERPVTIRDLLAHTSGVGFGPGFGYEPENDYETTYAEVVKLVDEGKIHSLADWCDHIAKLPLRFQPGKDWGYGYSSDILGRVVEVVSGRPLDEYLKAEVIEPLGMTDTAFQVPTAKAPRLAALYKREPWDGAGKNVKFITVDAGGAGHVDNSKKRVYARGSEPSTYVAPSTSVFLAGSSSKVLQGGGCVCSVAGGLVSSLSDYIRFGRMLLQEGELDGIRLLQPESVRLLARDWLNDFTLEKRKKPLWLWGQPGIGFSPLGQIGVKHPKAPARRNVGAALDTVHWGGAGGSGYMMNWPHRVLVLTYTGCTFDTETQKVMWKAAFGALRRGGAKPIKIPAAPASIANAPTPSKKRAIAIDDTKKGARASGSNGDSLQSPAKSSRTSSPSPKSTKK
eukprot:TRINITY_DN110255_c0_g1_i1.p1 TRINITY_DN110255_c0_g1~~TRINITY_DN110255_c0_g1_i1.p1  ORF type:complete len:501 (-),score=88.78 TRINITY_DN110255_c0_g1_i1:262-1593(-)